MVEIKWRPIYSFYCVYNVLPIILESFGTMILQDLLYNILLFINE